MERFVVLALNNMSELNKEFIEIENAEDKKGVAPIVKFTIQSDPISEVGINGVQVTDMLEYIKNLYVELNSRYSCIENEKTIEALELALKYQEERTRNRVDRGVEGKNEA